MKLCIDPGHGMSNRAQGVYDPGAVSGGVSEADIALAWALTLKWVCEQNSIPVFMTRRDDRESARLGDRDNRANAAGCTHYLALHCNAAGILATGTETYYRDANDRAFAQFMQFAAIHALGTKDRGLKSEGQSQHPRLSVFDFKGPAALVELAFITNPLERIKLQSRDRRLDFARYAVKYLKDHM